MMNDAYNSSYSIADLKLTLRCPKQLEITEGFKAFMEKQDGRNQYVVEFLRINSAEKMSGVLLAKNQDFSVFLNEDGRIVRCYHDHKRNDAAYAWTTFDKTKKKISVKYLPEGEQFFSDSGNAFFHIGWESILIQENRLILHASCVETPFGGVLFTGKSGVGKSTQADLWCKYQNARQINGDRPILYRKAESWYASGSPYAGSSGCYVNDKCRIRIIIALQQAAHCKLQKISGMDAFRTIFEGLTINNWDSEFVEKACDLTKDIIAKIPVYRLLCTPDKNAVEVLRKELEKGEMAWMQKK